MDKRRFNLFALALFLVLLSLSVYAQSTIESVIGQLSNAVGDITSAYEKYFYFIDAILYFIIIVGAVQIGLGSRLEGRGGKAVTIGVGIALSIAAAAGEKIIGFKLGDLWPLAIIMALLAISFGFYGFIKKISGSQNRAFALLGFTFLWYFLNTVAPKLIEWMKSHKNLELVWNLLHIIALFCLIWGIIELLRSLFGVGGASAGGVEGGGGEGGRRGPLGRLWDHMRRRGEEEGEEILDYGQPGTVRVKVVDLHGKPINGAEVVITGAKGGWPRALPGWRKRGPFFRNITLPDGSVPPFEGVP
ncbi:MAG: hypothetical protein N3D84_02340, partial [Candidatus Woesearchaeota archaeon]|nr:hypothetical protein [Candidatus Woesearchaeota archaeon]